MFFPQEAERHLPRAYWQAGGAGRLQGLSLLNLLSVSAEPPGSPGRAGSGTTAGQGPGITLHSVSSSQGSLGSQVTTALCTCLALDVLCPFPFIPRSSVWPPGSWAVLGHQGSSPSPAAQGGSQDTVERVLCVPGQAGRKFSPQGSPHFLFLNYPHYSYLNVPVPGHIPPSCCLHL